MARLAKSIMIPWLSIGKWLVWRTFYVYIDDHLVSGSYDKKKPTMHYIYNFVIAQSDNLWYSRTVYSLGLISYSLSQLGDLA